MMNLLNYIQILSFLLPFAFLSCSNDTIKDIPYKHSADRDRQEIIG